MASPDFSSYIDLTIYDSDPETIYDNAVAYAQTAIPEWTPISGSVEDAIIQAGASYAAELGGSINRLPNGVLEGLLQLFGITRNTGTAPTGTLTINVIDDLGYTVPAGTRFGYLDTTDPENSVLYSFDTTQDVSISQGSTSASVAIVGTSLIQYPTLLSGTTLQVLSGVSYVNSATLASNISVGADPETDTEYLARAIAKLNSYSTAMITADQIQQYVLSAYSDVYRCKVYSRRNAAADNASAALQNGYVTIYACKQGGASLTATAASVIQTDVADKTVAGLSITCKAPPIVPVTVTATVKMASGYGQAAVSSNVSSALSSFLHPDYWPWGAAIYYNDIVSLIDQAIGVDRVVSLSITVASGATASGSDWVFDKVGALPLVTPNITVTA